MKIMPGAVTVEATAATGEEHVAMVIDIGNKVQETEQVLPPQDQIRAKEMTIPEGKTTMTNVDFVGKRSIGQRTCGSSTHIKRKCPWNKRTEQTNDVELLLNGKLVTGLLESGSSISLISVDTYERLG